MFPILRFIFRLISKTKLTLFHPTPFPCCPNNDPFVLTSITNVIACNTISLPSQIIPFSGGTEKIFKIITNICHIFANAYTTRTTTTFTHGIYTSTTHKQTKPNLWPLQRNDFETNLQNGGAYIDSLNGIVMVQTKQGVGRGRGIMARGPTVGLRGSINRPAGLPIPEVAVSEVAHRVAATALGAQPTVGGVRGAPQTRPNAFGTLLAKPLPAKPLPNLPGENFITKQRHIPH